MADVNIGRNGSFEATSAQKEVALIGAPGGSLSNAGSQNAMVNFDNEAVTMSDEPGDGVRELSVGVTVNIPRHCRAFKIIAAGDTKIQYEPRN